MFIDITERKNGMFISGDIVERITPDSKDIFLITSRLAGSDDMFLPEERAELFDSVAGVWSPPGIRRLHFLSEFRKNDIYRNVSEETTLAMFDMKLVTEEMMVIDPTLRNADIVVINVRDFEKFLFSEDLSGDIPEALIRELYLLLAPYYGRDLDSDRKFSLDREKLRRIINSYSKYPSESESVAIAGIIKRVQDEVMLPEDEEPTPADITQTEAVKYPFLIGMSSRKYDDLSDAARTALAGLVNVAVLEASDEEMGDKDVMLQKLVLAKAERIKEGQIIFGAGLVEIDPATVDMPLLVEEFVSEMFMELRSRTEMDEGMLAAMFDAVSSRFSNIGTLDLSSLSLYQMKIGDAYNRYYERPVQDTNRVEYIPDVSKVKGDHYMVHYADGDVIMDEQRSKAIMPVGLEIQKRRQTMKVTRDNDTAHDKFYIMLPKDIKTPEAKRIFKDNLMSRWMLDGVVGEEDIVLLPYKEEGYMTFELYDKLRVDNTGENINVDNTGFRTIMSRLNYDIGAQQSKILQVDLDMSDRAKAASNLNQYEVFVNLLISRDIEALDRIQGLTEGVGRLFVYAPKAEIIDLERAVRAYETYVTQVLIKA